MTASSPPPPVSKAQSSSLPDFVPEPLPAYGDLYSDASSAFKPYLGFLRDAGLDFGWGPASLMQWVLEHFHVWGAFPWWGTVAATALFSRAVALPFILNSVDMGGRLAALAPLTKPITDRMRAAQQAGDTKAQQEIAREMKQVYSAAEIKFSKMLLPFIVQIPLGYGAWRLLRNIADLSTVGLEDGGLLWFVDLTVKDPYYTLPAVTASLLFIILKVGEAHPPILFRQGFMITKACTERR